jgi:serine/threonine-protein kinase
MAEPGTLRTDHLDLVGPVADPIVGQVIADRYRVLRKLGGGGMGAVYEAEHTLIGRRVAIKLLHAALVTDVGVIKRFLNEARAAGMLGHPNILESTDMGRMPDGSPFLVLELLEGRDLDKEIAASGPLPIGRAVRIAMQIASALQAAHDKGIVHRDLKPENVFLTVRPGQADHVKVLDFGISKFGGGLGTGVGTQTGAMMGTPYFMAPEQMSDASKSDARADVYALGTVLYTMLSGRVPFHADTLPSLMIKVLTEPPSALQLVRPDVPDGLAAAIGRAMAKSADARFASMNELAAAIEPFAGLDGAPRVMALSASQSMLSPRLAAGPSTVEHAPAPRSRRGLVAGVVLGGLALVGGSVYLLASPSSGRSAATTTALVLATTAPAPPATSAPQTAPPAAPPTVAFAVSADRAGASVTVRGERHPLPWVGEVPRSDAPEPIEVLAPDGHGLRFLVVLDGPKTLSADLPRRGRGVRDATDTETAAALAGGPPATGRDRGPRPLAATAGGTSTPATTTAPAAPAATTAPRRPDGVYRGPEGDIPTEI